LREYSFQGKKLQKEGMALLTVLSVMVILLILSLAIVTLSTGNLKTVGNINSRLSALNLANTASMYALYEIQTDFNSAAVPWGPGPVPTPSSHSFTEYIPIPDENLNGISGRCSVAYYDNLSNPGTVTLSVPATFSSFLGTSIDVSGEEAIILAQGQHEGFKRSIKVLVKHIYYCSAAEGLITLEDGLVSLNGIENIYSLAPYSGSMYATGGIDYNNITSFNFFSSSKLISHGAINNMGTGMDIEPEYLRQGHPEITIIDDWSIADPNLTNPNTYPPLSFFASWQLCGSNESLPAPVPTEIVRPSFKPPYAPTPAIPDSKRYVAQDTNIYINQNTFINGSIRIPRNLTITNNSSLYVNGTLTVDGSLNGWEGNIFVAGYYGDPNSTSCPFGTSMEVKGTSFIFPVSMDHYHPGVGVFSEGDIKIGNRILPPFQPPNPTAVKNWLLIIPSDLIKVKATFESLGLSMAGSTDAKNWFDTGAVPAGSPIVTVTGFSGYQILCGQANNELMANGIKPVTDEVADWFLDGNSTQGFSWTCSAMSRWDTFKKNPSIYHTANDAFIQGVFYTYGTFTTENTLYPVRIIGGVISKDRSGVSPPGHGGNIKLTDGSSIIFHTKIFENKSGKSIVKPILTVYAWEELY